MMPRQSWSIILKRPGTRRSASVSQTPARPGSGARPAEALCPHPLRISGTGGSWTLASAGWCSGRARSPFGSRRRCLGLHFCRGGQRDPVGFFDAAAAVDESGVDCAGLGSGQGDCGAVPGVAVELRSMRNESCEPASTKN
jgi:hypothetical protein